MTIERLGPAHQVDGFSCGNEELDSWLHNTALTADRAGTARVYVDVDDATVLGYFALSPHLVQRVDIPPRIGRGAPETIPSFLLARLALAQDVDAIDEGAAAFYEHHGFRPTPTGPFRLVMKASTAAASVGIDWP